MILNQDYVLFFSSALMIVILIFQIRRKNEIKSKQLLAQPNEFVFKGKPGSGVWAMGVVLTNSAINWGGWNIGLLLFIILYAAVVFMSIAYAYEVLLLEEDGVQVQPGLLKVKSEVITGISISEYEVALHTKKYKNHHCFKDKTLRSKNWVDFLDAIEQYAFRFDHIKIERV